MAATTINDSLLNGLRQHLAAGMAAYGQYKVGSLWHNAPIDQGEVKKNGSVCISFLIEAQDAVITPATQFRLCAENGDVLAEREEEVAFSETVKELLYRFRFEITAEEEESE